MRILKRVSVELLKWGFSCALPKPTQAYLFCASTNKKGANTRGSPYVVLLNVCLGRCPNPLTFFPKELTFGKIQTSLLLLSLNRSFALTQKSKQKRSRLDAPSRPAECARSLNVENSPSAQTVRRFSSLTFAQAGLRLGAQADLFVRSTNKKGTNPQGSPLFRKS